MMKRFNFYNLIVLGLFLVFSFTLAHGQGLNRFQEVENPSRPNLLQELDLSPDQVRQIRRLNQERRPIMQNAQRRLRDANQALDRAIYADTDNDAEIQTRMTEVQAAQMEVIKNRTATERAIRRILNTEQLTKFRNLRAQFMQKNAPQNRINNRQERLRNLPRGLRQRRLANRRNQRQTQ